jgi:hypothetical protein
MNDNNQAANPQPYEIVQIPNAGFDVVKMPMTPQTIILAFTLPNGRQYQFLLDEGGRKSMIKKLSGVHIYVAGDLPDN